MSCLELKKYISFNNKAPSGLQADEYGNYRNCGGVKVLELNNSSSTIWTTSQELNAESTQICNYVVDYYFNFYDIENETAPPTPGIHLSYGNGRLYDNKQYSTHSYGRSENDITIENVASKNTVDTFSTNGQEYAYLLYSPSSEYPEECSIGTFQINSITTPTLAVPDLACTSAMLSGSTEDSIK